MNLRAVSSTLSVLAALDVIAIVFTFVGAGRCGRGDGCLLFSLLLFVAVCAAGFVLLLSGATLLLGRRKAMTSRHFIASNLVLFIVTIGIVGIAIWHLR
jgi:uncharacterized membrane protein